MARQRIDDRDIIKMVLAVIFGRGVWGFLETSGMFEDLSMNLGGSMPAAYLVLMVGAGLILLWGF